MPNGQKKEVKVRFPEKLSAGVYANNMFVSHTKEEFIMDFLMIAPPGGVVTSRIIVSPGHIKRIIAALQENIKKYENRFGDIQQAEEPLASLKFH
jgi:hypothetical protein